MTNKEYASLLLPGIEKSVSDYEAMYPKRILDTEAIVTRYAPSPTGFVHMGNLFSCLIEQKMAHQTGGVFYLRIEDTDQKRTIENGVSSIIRDLKNFQINFEEGMTSETEEVGNYGPYLQSNRKEIYWAFAKHLIENDLAYPCFCTEAELEEIRKVQERNKERIGYYGSYAKYHNITKEEAIKHIENGEKYVIRLKSNGNFNRKFVFSDAIRGKMELPENDLDIVLIKGDELPTYHFAHLVDDHLMRTTHVIRGDEWLSSVPIHVQLFSCFGFEAPIYAHVAPLLKEDNGTRRKLSKRKDPEAAVNYYHEQGIPKEAVLIYLMTVANSNFESWYEQNSDQPLSSFTMSFKKMSASGSMFDLEKLLNISRNYLSRLTSEEVLSLALAYTLEYDQELYQLLNSDLSYALGIFSIERYQKKPRKDLAMMSSLRDQLWYMYDSLFEKNEEEYQYQTINDLEEIRKIITTYINEYYDESDAKETWFNKIKELSFKFGYAKEVKEYKENPDNYKGHVGDIATVLRVALTKKAMTPDLYEMMKLIGKERIKNRYLNMKD